MNWSIFVEALSTEERNDLSVALFRLHCKELDSDCLNNEERMLGRAKQKIQAIKHYKERKQCGLKEALDAYKKEFPEQFPQ